MRTLALWGGMLGVVLLAPLANAAEPASLPKVVLIGDSIRMSYAPLVARQLDAKAVVISAQQNGGDSANVLKHLEQWAIDEQPAIVHFNCGIHDTKKDKKTGKFQVSPDEYEANLRKIVERLRAGTKAKVIFATTTPILDDAAAEQRQKAAYELLDASVVEYNRIALRVMKELDVPVNDLHAACGDAANRARLIEKDGVHFNAAGRALLGEAVVKFLSPHLTQQQ